MNHKEGFSLVELLIYIALFAVISLFLVGILTTFTRIQVRQSAANEINNQISFVSSVVKEMVQNSSLVYLQDGVTTSTLDLRMASSSVDPTLIYASGTAIYLQQGNAAPVALTNSNVTVNNFSVTPYKNPGGSTVVQTNLSLTYNNPNPASQFSQSLQLAVARISAATFDSALYPASSTSLDVGSAASPWGNGWFNGSLHVFNADTASNQGEIYAGTGVSGSVALKANGNVGFYSASQGLILNSGSNCYLLGVNASGTLSTTLVSCP